MLEEILRAGKAGLADDKYTLMLGKSLFGSSGSGERTLTGTLPLSFISDGEPLLDWQIKGASGGVGKYEFNYLRQEPVTVDNGQPAGTQYAGTVSYNYAVSGPAIPSGGAFVPAHEQWMVSSYSKIITIGSNRMGVDDRAVSYSNCQYRFRLSAGSYKLVMEAIDHSGQWLSDKLSHYPSASNWRGTPVIALLKPDSQVVLQSEFDRTLYQGDTFIHIEYPFTVTGDIELGLFFQGLGHNISSEEFIPRFMVVDSDTVAEPFSVTVSTRTYEGVSCWDTPHAILPVTVSCGGQTTTVDIDLGGSLLYENDTVTFTGTGTTVPTYRGRNVLDADSYVMPSEVTVRYTGR